MRHIHIALVGAQPMPVYIGIKDCNPDKVIFVCSAKTRTEAERVQREITCLSEIQEFDPVDLPSIAAQTKALAEGLSTNIVSINISGGTKPWTYYFIENFGQLSRTKIIYVDQNNTVLNFTDQTWRMIDFNINMDVLFRLYGNSPKMYRKLSRYTEGDMEAIDKIKDLRRFNCFDFTKLTNNFDIKTNLFKLQKATGSSLEWIQEKGAFIFRLFNRDGQSQMQVFDSPNIRELLLNAGWFEVEVAFLLSKWSKANEVRLNCVFPAKDSTSKNEIDIIVNTGVKLLFIECKTQIYSAPDIDKFRSAANNYGGMGCKTLFITDERMNLRALEKCGDNNVQSFSIKGNGGIQNCQKALFELLDEELFKINPK